MEEKPQNYYFHQLKQKIHWTNRKLPKNIVLYCKIVGILQRRNGSFGLTPIPLPNMDSRKTLGRLRSAGRPWIFHCHPQCSTHPLLGVRDPSENDICGRLGKMSVHYWPNLFRIPTERSDLSKMQVSVFFKIIFSG